MSLADCGALDKQSQQATAQIGDFLILTSVILPTVITVTNSLGAQALARKKAIVSRLEAIEELAGVDILCSDKTGTLTKNILTLS